MLYQLPPEIINIIFAYYAELRGLKWCPFVTPNTGKLVWVVNRHSAKYYNINCLLKYKKKLHEANMFVDLTNNNTLINSYHTRVKIIVLDRYLNMNYIGGSLFRFDCYYSDTVYLEFSDDNHCTYYAFGVIKGDITNNVMDVYLDSNIFGTFTSICKNDGTPTKSITKVLNISASLEKY